MSMLVNTMNRAERRAAEAYIAKENAKFSEHMELWHPRDWPEHMRAATIQRGLLSVWRSRHYLAQVYEAQEPCVARISVNRAGLNGNEWQDNIPWEDMQRIKNELGYESLDALEIYPRQIDVVNVANLRHLWVMKTPISFAWRRS